MKLDHAAISSLVPHQGAMCLLDRVEEWDAQHIVCTSRQHLLASNPLRCDGRLSCIHGIEFAAQAMAVHGGLLHRAATTTTATPATPTTPTAGIMLLAPSAPSIDTLPQIGLLLSVRRCAFHCERLDVIETSLSIEARKIAGSESGLSYAFTVHSAGVLLIEGRAHVMLREGGSRVKRMSSKDGA